MIVLVLGGTRSGKSLVAEQRAAALAAGGDAAGVVTYFATAAPERTDGDHAARIASHRDRRPASWTTVECGARLPEALGDHPAATAIIDSLGSWIAAHPDLDADVEALVRSLRCRTGSTVVVAEEVGLAVHPPAPVSRRFVDRLGEANQAVAAVADEVLLVVAGRSLSLGAP